jgi:uncharacterized protein (DUF2384 family)
LVDQFSLDETPVQAVLKRLKQATSLPWQRIAQLLGVSRQSVEGWRSGDPITDQHRRHLFAVCDVLERAATTYRTQAELIAWLDTPRGADSHTPADLLAVRQTDRARLLAVTRPSPGVQPPPARITRPTPATFARSRERRAEAVPPDRDAELFALLSADDEDPGK